MPDFSFNFWHIMSALQTIFFFKHSETRTYGSSFVQHCISTQLREISSASIAAQYGLNLGPLYSALCRKRFGADGDDEKPDLFLSNLPAVSLTKVMGLVCKVTREQHVMHSVCVSHGKGKAERLLCFTASSKNYLTQTAIKNCVTGGFMMAVPKRR